MNGTLGAFVCFLRDFRAKREYRFGCESKWSCLLFNNRQFDCEYKPQADRKILSMAFCYCCGLSNGTQFSKIGVAAISGDYKKIKGSFV